jgi:hypothetical protein
LSVDLFTFVGLYDRAVATAAHILDKGWAHAAAGGVSESEMLDWRLIEDMQPLRFQIMVVCNFSAQWPARVAALPVPADVATDLTLAQFKASLSEARRFLGTLTREQFAGRDDAPLTHMIGTGMEPTLPAGQWLTGFATTNLYFHLSIAYAILRHKGVPIGKPDLFPTGL